jgi:hypothetical protein
MAIERRDLEAKLREIESIVDETRDKAKTTGTAIAVAVVIALVAVFLLGRRRGVKDGGARVEVYRLK